MTEHLVPFIPVITLIITLIVAPRFNRAADQHMEKQKRELGALDVCRNELEEMRTSRYRLLQRIQAGGHRNIQALYKILGRLEAKESEKAKEMLVAHIERCEAFKVEDIDEEAPESK